MRGEEYPELLAEICAFLVPELVRHGLDTARANEAAIAAVESVRSSFSGQLIYIPQGGKFKLEARDSQIYQRFNGTNLKELAKDFNLSVIYLYRVLAKQRAIKNRPTNPKEKKTCNS